MYLHFEPYLGFGLIQVDEIKFGTIIHVVCPTQPVPFLLMPWLLKLTEHQQVWYWLCRTDNMYYCQSRTIPSLASEEFKNPLYIRAGVCHWAFWNQGFYCIWCFLTFLVPLNQTCQVYIEIHKLRGSVSLLLMPWKWPFWWVSGRKM